MEDKLGRNQFSIESLHERLQIITNAASEMNDRWTRSDDATRMLHCYMVPYEQR